MPTAVVIDGAFFIHRFRHALPHLDASDPRSVRSGVTLLAHLYLVQKLGPRSIVADANGIRYQPEETSELYRIFFYDCPPVTKRIHKPVSKTAVDLSKTGTARFRLALHEELRRTRKIALRLGRLNEEVTWRLKPEVQRRWLAGAQPIVPTDDDFELAFTQKGVDMRLGIDIASMSYRGKVDQIVLVAADSDFVPAVKLARREGIDVVVDGLGGMIADDLAEHCDGIRHTRWTAHERGDS